MKNQIMERQARRRVSFHLCGHATAAKAWAFSLFLFYLRTADFSLSFCLAFSKTSSILLNPLSLISSLWLLLVIYFVFSSSSLTHTKTLYSLLLTLALIFFSSIIVGSFYFPSFFPPSFWPIVACKFLLPFPILLDWSFLFCYFFSFSFRDFLYITQRLSLLLTSVLFQLDVPYQFVRIAQQQCNILGPALCELDH